MFYLAISVHSTLTYISFLSCLLHGNNPCRLLHAGSYLKRRVAACAPMDYRRAERLLERINALPEVHAVAYEQAYRKHGRNDVKVRAYAAQLRSSLEERWEAEGVPFSKDMLCGHLPVIRCLDCRGKYIDLAKHIVLPPQRYELSGGIMHALLAPNRHVLHLSGLRDLADHLQA
jgi:hypothetical protein